MIFLRIQDCFLVTFKDFKMIILRRIFNCFALLAALGLMLLWPTDLSAASQPSQQDRIYRAFVHNEMHLWEPVIREMEQQRGASAPRLYDLLLARYGYIAWCLDKDRKNEALVQLEQAEKEIELLMRNKDWQSQAYALQGALLGFRISLRPLAAMRLGPRSYKAIDTALELNPDNPTAWLERGNSRFYTPSTFGGSKAEAANSYRKAVELFERNLTPNHRWLYLNALVGLAKSYEYTDRPLLAVLTYRKALAYEPNFKWVSEDLLPKALEKIK